jgi:hypothetical protein
MGAASSIPKPRETNYIDTNTPGQQEPTLSVKEVVKQLFESLPCIQTLGTDRRDQLFNQMNLADNEPTLATNTIRVTQNPVTKDIEIEIPLTTDKSRYFEIGLKYDTCHAYTIQKMANHVQLPKTINNMEDKTILHIGKSTQGLTTEPSTPQGNGLVIRKMYKGHKIYIGKWDPTGKFLTGKGVVLATRMDSVTVEASTWKDGCLGVLTDKGTSYFIAPCITGGYLKVENEGNFKVDLGMSFFVKKPETEEQLTPMSQKQFDTHAFELIELTLNSLTRD